MLTYKNFIYSFKLNLHSHTIYNMYTMCTYVHISSFLGFGGTLFFLFTLFGPFFFNTALRVSQSFYYFTTSISLGAESYSPRLWGMGISDAIFYTLSLPTYLLFYMLYPAASLHNLHYPENILAFILFEFFSIS